MRIKRFVGGMLESNGYIVSCSGAVNDNRECYIIDPGYNPKKFVKFVQDNNFKVLGILLTHHHYDHTGAANKVKKELGCPIMMHSGDIDIYGKDVDVYLSDGDVFEMKGIDEEGKPVSDKLVVIHTPGHTHGGICLMSSKSKVCFTGDTVFNIDIGRIDLEDGSEDEMVRSVRNIINTWSNEIMCYPGHGDPATMKSIRKINREYQYIIENY